MSLPAEKRAGLLGNPYNSSDGMQTAVFGPPLWMMIHMVSFNYPTLPTETDKMLYKNWLFTIGSVLPCKYCRDNFLNNIKAAGFGDHTMDNRASFSRFCYDLHNVVNAMLKKENVVSYEEVCVLYENFRASCLSADDKKKLKINGTEEGCLRPSHNGRRGMTSIRVHPRADAQHQITVDPACCRKV